MTASRALLVSLLLATSVAFNGPFTMLERCTTERTWSGLSNRRSSCLKRLRGLQNGWWAKRRKNSQKQVNSEIAGTILKKCDQMQLAGQKQCCDSASSQGLLSVQSIRFATARVPLSPEDSGACSTQDAAQLTKCSGCFLQLSRHGKTIWSLLSGRCPHRHNSRIGHNRNLAKNMFINLFSMGLARWESSYLHSQWPVVPSIQNPNVRFDLGSCAKQRLEGSCGGTHSCMFSAYLPQVGI